MKLLSALSKSLTTFLACLLAMPLFSTSINSLNNLSLQNRSASSGLITADGHFLFYRQLAGQDAAIIRLNLSNMSETTLLNYEGAQIKAGSPMVQLKNGHIILRANVIDNSQLWQSTGGESFEPLTSDNLSSRNGDAYQLNGYYFILHNDGSLVWTNGTLLKNQAFSRPVIPLCAFSNELYLFAEQLGGLWLFKLYDQGQISSVFDGYRYHPTRIPAAHTSESCVIKASNSAGETQHLFFHQDGRAINTNRNDDKVLAMTDRYVAVDDQASPFIPSQIESYDANNLTILDSFSFNNTLLQRMSIVSDRVLLYLSPTNNVQQTQLTILNQSLNLISEGIALTNDQTVVSTLNRDFIIGNNALKIYDNGIYQNQLPWNQQFEHIFYNNLLTNTLIYSETSIPTSTLIEKFNIIDINPGIGPQLNGPWFDIDFLNQGLSINPGQRADGSHYVFLTFFLYRDGQPLWLAGNKNYLPGQKTITLELFEYEGAGFLDTNTTPERTEFGTLNLTFNSCDGLDGIVQFNDQTQSFNFRRIDDTSFNYLCVTP